jgi:stage V sporulation protein G
MESELIDIKVLKIQRLTGEGRVRAFVDIGINDAILIKGLKVVESTKGDLFVSMPQELGKNERWYERVRCLKPDVKEVIQDVILEAYQN